MITEEAALVDQKRGLGYWPPILMGVAFASLNAIMALIIASPIWSVTSLLIFVLFIYLVAVHAPASFSLLLPTFCMYFTVMLSGAAIENGAYMPETWSFGHGTGAFSRLLLLYIASFSASIIVIEAIWLGVMASFMEAVESNGDRYLLFYFLTITLVGVGVAFLFIIGAKSGFPLFNHVDRFRFAADQGKGIYFTVLTNRVVFAPVLGCLASIRRFRLSIFIITGLMVVVSVLLGEKFTSLIQISTGFFGPMMLRYVVLTGRLPTKYILGGVALFPLAVMPLILLAYSGKAVTASGASLASGRIAEQGQLWYHADRISGRNFHPDLQVITKDIKSWFQPSEQNAQAAGKDFGLYLTMSQFSDQTTVYYFMSDGNGFAFVLHPYLLMYWSIPLLYVVSIIMAIYQSLFLCLLIISFIKSQWIAAMALGRVMNSYLPAIFSGYLWNVFGVKPLASFAFAVLLLFIRSDRFAFVLRSKRIASTAFRKDIERPSLWRT